MYLFCECDNAGIWEVDLEVAGLYCGETYTLEDFEKAFAGRIYFFNNGSKAFLPEFIVFQYGGVSNLNPTNNAHKSVLQNLKIRPYTGIERRYYPATARADVRGWQAPRQEQGSP